MSKDLTDALRRLMEGDSNTNVVPSLNLRGSAPAAKSSAVLAKSGSAGGVVSPLTETSSADRTYHADVALITSDGIFEVLLQPIATMSFADGDGNPLAISLDVPA